jgi:hypothetical protein
MNLIKKNWSKLVLLTYVSIFPVVSFAAEGEVPPPCTISGKICNPLSGGVTSIPGLIHTILVGMLQIGIPIVALAIIYCGFLFVFARGNSEKITHAKDALLYTLIGAAILLGAWAIAQMISSTVLAL